MSNNFKFGRWFIKLISSFVTKQPGPQLVDNSICGTIPFSVPPIRTNLQKTITIFGSLILAATNKYKIYLNALHIFCIRQSLHQKLLTISKIFFEYIKTRPFSKKNNYFVCYASKTYKLVLLWSVFTFVGYRPCTT